MHDVLIIVLTLGGILALSWLIRKIIPDTPLTGSGCCGG
jgi:hypothetical protein